jgi:hypothetical protein
LRRESSLKPSHKGFKEFFAFKLFNLERRTILKFSHKGLESFFAFRYPTLRRESSLKPSHQGFKEFFCIPLSNLEKRIQLETQGRPGRLAGVAVVAARQHDLHDLAQLVILDNGLRG